MCVPSCLTFVSRHPTGSKSGKLVLNSPLVKRVIQIESPAAEVKGVEDKVVEKVTEKPKGKGKGKEKAKEAGFDGREIYFIGIIDMLTVYDFGKKVAHSAKSIAYKSVLYPANTSKLWPDAQRPLLSHLASYSTPYKTSQGRVQCVLRLVLIKLVGRAVDRGRHFLRRPLCEVR